MLSGDLKELLEVVENKEKDWKARVKEAEVNFGDDIIDTLGIIGRSKSTTSQNYQDAIKLINARIGNLESNLHIEIDMERIEDRSKALSYIGIEVADALKVIPTPVDYNVEEDQIQEVEETVVTKPVTEKVEQSKVSVNEQKNAKYLAETRVDVKPTLWQRIKNSKVVRAISYVFKIKVVLDMPVLPEGRGE